MIFFLLMMLCENFVLVAENPFNYNTVCTRLADSKSIDRAGSYNVIIQIAILRENAQPVWHTKVNKQVQNGVSVPLILRGDNVVLRFSIMLCEQNDDSILMVTKGGIWLSSVLGKVQHRSIFYTQPINFSTPVRIHPFGKKGMRKSWNSRHTLKHHQYRQNYDPYDLEMIIEVRPR